MQLLTKPVVKNLITTALGNPPALEIICLDYNYAVPSRHYVETILTDDMQKNFKALGLQYTEESFDCDNFALLTHALAQTAHHRTVGKVACGLSLAVVMYMPLAASGHMMNLVIVDSPSQVKVYEPQTGKLSNIDVSFAEMCSVLTVIM